MATTILSLIDAIRRHLHEPLVLRPPAAPTVVVVGVAGVTQYGYVISATRSGFESDGGAIGVTATGFATLDGTHINRLTWAAVTGAFGYKVYRVEGGTTQGLIATITSGATLTVDDNGLAGDGVAPPAVNFWTDDELVAIFNRGERDLWRAIYTKHQKHFFSLNVSLYLAAGGSTLTDVPADCAVVLGLEPLDLTGGLRFEHRDYNHAVFQMARAADAIDPSMGGVIYFDFTEAGGPVGAPVVYVAPAVTARVNLRLSYVPTLVEVTIAGTNPIPGESDQALIAWTVAHALAKDDDTKGPDQTWLALYATEKGNILEAVEPRDESEDDVVEAVFEPYW
jgi:hypothetical protein